VGSNPTAVMVLIFEDFSLARYAYGLSSFFGSCLFSSLSICLPVMVLILIFEDFSLGRYAYGLSSFFGSCLFSSLSICLPLLRKKKKKNCLPLT
jgi:hypothetical protein